jgi:hypothetical protein
MKRADLNDPLKIIGRRALQFMMAIGIILVLLELSLHRGSSEAEYVPLFYAVFGVLAVIVFVLAGLALKSAVMRGEGYYDDK